MIIVDRASLTANYRNVSSSKIQWPNLNGIILVSKIQPSQLKPHTPRHLVDEYTNSIKANCCEMNWVTLFRFRKSLNLSLLIQLLWIVSLISIERIDRSCMRAYFRGAFPSYTADPISCFCFCIDLLTLQPADIKFFYRCTSQHLIFVVLYYELITCAVVCCESRYFVRAV